MQSNRNNKLSPENMQIEVTNNTSSADFKESSLSADFAFFNCHGTMQDAQNYPTLALLKAENQSKINERKEEEILIQAWNGLNIKNHNK